MPFDARLIAIDRLLGKYSVHSQVDGDIDQQKFRQSARVADLSANPGYRDFVGIFSREEILALFNPSGATSTWLEGLPKSIEFIMLVLEEWESGMSMDFP
jgi:hypothetical protein